MAAILVSCFVVTGSPQISVTCNNRRVLFLAHITCLWQISTASATAPCVFSFHDPGRRAAHIWDRVYSEQREKRKNQWRPALAIKTSFQTLCVPCLLTGEWPRQVTNNPPAGTSGDTGNLLGIPEEPGRGRSIWKQ